MKTKKNILVLNGSASARSSNEQLIRRFGAALGGEAEVNVWPDLKSVPHFDPEQSIGDAPPEVVAIRQRIGQADAILICTPEYIFSIPSGLKNVLEWCVATTVFTDKPVGIITASASGIKGHEELQLILRTLMARLSEEAMLLISGIKGKIDATGGFTDQEVAGNFERFVNGFCALAGGSGSAIGE